jgi:hypothetical protein
MGFSFPWKGKISSRHISRFFSKKSLSFCVVVNNFVLSSYFLIKLLWKLDKSREFCQNFWKRSVLHITGRAWKGVQVSHLCREAENTCFWPKNLYNKIFLFEASKGYTASKTGKQKFCFVYYFEYSLLNNEAHCSKLGKARNLFFKN